MTKREIARRGLILEVVTGSQMLGLAVDDSDEDRTGVAVPPPECVLGVEDEFKSFDRKLEVGDADQIVYGLLHFSRLALNGNPSLLNVLYAPEAALAYRSNVGKELQEIAWAFNSKLGPQVFLRYMERQIERLDGERGQMRVKRPELVEAHGYDTKYAMHILRIGWQGIQYARNARVMLPLSENIQMALLDVREGRVPYDEFRRRADEVKGDLAAEIEGGLPELPDEPERSVINGFLQWAHIERWGGTDKGKRFRPALDSRRARGATSA